MFPIKTKQNKIKQNKTENWIPECALGRKKKYLINCIDLDTFSFSRGHRSYVYSSIDVMKFIFKLFPCNLHIQ